MRARNSPKTEDSVGVSNLTFFTDSYTLTYSPLWCERQGLGAMSGEVELVLNFSFPTRKISNDRNNDILRNIVFVKVIQYFLTSETANDFRISVRRIATGMMDEEIFLKQ